MSIVDEFRRVAQDQSRPEQIALSQRAWGEAEERRLGGWRTVGAVGQPSFLNGWSAFGGDLVQFFKDRWGMVHLRGRVTNAGFSLTTIFVLPVEYRFSEPILLGVSYLLQYTSGAQTFEEKHAAEVDTTTGDVRVNAYSLGGITSPRSLRYVTLNATLS